MERGSSFEAGRPRSTWEKNLGEVGQEVWGGIENWTTFMDVICVSSLFKVNKEDTRTAYMTSLYYC